VDVGIEGIVSLDVSEARFEGLVWRLRRLSWMGEASGNDCPDF
jgi:hypothetical protein